MAEAPVTVNRSDGIPVHAGIAALAEQYDGFLVDVWGVLHDGFAPFPGVPEALRHLRARGRRVVLLTNSSRRADNIAEQLAGIGVAPDLYDAIVSSGELAYGLLGRLDHPLLAGCGRRCLAVGADYARPWLDEHGLEAADERGADFVLLTSLEKADEPIAEARRRLAAACERDLPLVCANPDKIVLIGPDLFVECGTLAAEYATAGGRVLMLGKPHGEIYVAAVGRLEALGARRLLAIGDSLETDVRGARAAGLDVAFVPAGGVHREALGLAYGELPEPERLAKLAERHRAEPDLLLAALRPG